MLGPVERFCRNNNLPWNSDIADRLGHFLELIDEFRDSMNLIGPLSDEAIVRELLADSLAPAAVRAPAGRILDVGTGAGFPGIPLACLYPMLPVTLVEPRKKRHTFLKIAKTRLELDNVETERSRIEQLSPSPYDYVISKAFKPPDEWIPLASPWLADSSKKTDPGVIVCLTRPDDRDSIDDIATNHGLELLGFIADTAELGAPAADPPRAIAVVGRPRHSASAKSPPAAADIE